MSNEVSKHFKDLVLEGRSVPEGSCILCEKPFTNKNVYSEAGWRETKITQMCELCFDDATEEEE